MTQVRLVPVATDEHKEMLATMIVKTGTEAGLDPYATGDSTYWLIEAKTDDGWFVSGYTGIHSVNWVSRRCRGLLWILPDARRKGIGEAALRMRNAMLFDQMNMNRIEWVVPIENSARVTLAAKMGQHCEGIAREAVWYDGKYHDYAMYSTIRSDREVV